MENILYFIIKLSIILLILDYICKKMFKFSLISLLFKIIKGFVVTIFKKIIDILLNVIITLAIIGVIGYLIYNYLGL